MMVAKMLHPKVIVISIVFLSILMYRCESTTEVEPEEPSGPYKVGDIREYLYERDSSYQISEIVGKTRRIDGQEVFIVENRKSNLLPDKWVTDHFYIKDGYELYTALDTVNEGELRITNPFHEIRRAKIFPKEGDSWHILIGYPDSLNNLVTAKYLGTKLTPAAVFNNVYNFTQYDLSFNDTVNSYYSVDFGPLGNSHSNTAVGTSTLLNYIKTDVIELGKFVPFE